MQIASPRDDEQELVALDGRVGGGHVLRSALCLAAVTGRGFALERFRQDCKMPGLLRSHLAVVRAMAEVCQAEVTGAALNCTSLQFKPGRLVAGEYAFAVGAAGSAIVLLQTVATALLHADGVSTVTVRGGTHVSSAPPFAFVQQSWLPALRKMGAKIDVTLEQWGFFPAGGGQVRATVHPSPLQPIALDKRGALLGIKVVAASSLLNAKVARRELRTLTTGLKELQVQGIELPVVTQEAMAVRDSPGPGNICWLELAAAQGTTVLSETGHKDCSAEEVAERLLAQTKAWLSKRVPIDGHLASQLLLPMALAGGGSFVTAAPTAQFHGQAKLLGVWLGARVELVAIPAKSGDVVRVVVHRA